MEEEQEIQGGVKTRAKSKEKKVFQGNHEEFYEEEIYISLYLYFKAILVDM